MLKGSRIDLLGESDIDIENKVLCDSHCLCALLRELEWISENCDKHGGETDRTCQKKM